MDPLSTVVYARQNNMSPVLLTRNPLYNGALFHCYMLDEFICHIRSVGSTLSLLLCPRDDSRGALRLRFAPVCPSVCLSVRLSVRPFVTLYGIEFV